MDLDLRRVVEGQTAMLPAPPRGTLCRSDSNPCLSPLPWSSTAFTSAWQLISSATIPSTARRAARISGVVPSFILASRSVTRLRIRIYRRRKDGEGVTWVKGRDRAKRGIEGLTAGATL